jgi:hypothetical protein
MKEIRKVYRQHAVLSRPHSQIPVGREDLIALIEDADELDRLRESLKHHAQETLGKLLVRAGVDLVELVRGYRLHLFHGGPVPYRGAVFRYDTTTAKEIGADVWKMLERMAESPPTK